VSDSAGSKDHDSIVEDLVARIHALVAAAPNPMVDFARAYLRRVPHELLTARDPDELAAHVADIFAFLRNRRDGEISVRVFNPTLDEHGYTTTGAVIEIVTPDTPFLVDSVVNAIQSRGHDVDWVIHPVVGMERNADGELQAVVPARTAPHRESIQHHEVEGPVSVEEAAKLVDRLRLVLSAVRRAVDDFEPMQGAVYRMIKLARDGAALYERDEVDEAVAFLEWLLDFNFVFLGYREYRIEDTPERVISIVPDSGLGILSRADDSRFATPVAVDSLPDALRHRYESGDLLVLSKTNNPSPVHRRAKMDYIGVRRIDEKGNVIGEARMVGLFTSKAYMEPADTIPLLRRKLGQILDEEDTISGSHYHKQLVQIFNSFPKDELFASPTSAIRESVVGLISAQEQEGVRLFVHRDLLQRNVTLLVVVPRDRFDAELRKSLQRYFVEQFNGTSVDYQLSLGETDTARIHFTVWVAEGEVPDVSFGDLEAGVLERTRTWQEQVEEALVDRLGEVDGRDLSRRWAPRFPTYYQGAVDLELAAGDIERLDELRSGGGRPVVGLQNESRDGEALTRLAVYRRSPKLELSAIMPTLEDLGLRIIEEVPTRLKSKDGDYFIHDFGVLDRSGEMLDLGRTASQVGAAISAVLDGSCESDSLNRLVAKSPLDHTQVRILRAYRTYWQRVSPAFTAEYINDAFAAHPLIASDLVALFEARFTPGADPKDAGRTENRIVAALEQVASLDEDRILRSFLDLILATERTNAFMPDRESLSFKFRSERVPDMPAPAPLFEIFVFAPDVEGIHLRGGRVARGGIRWSTRKEDYRTEVLGLMKAQMTKNAVIVPTGSKGGFVLRNLPIDRDAMRNAVKEAYTTFIRGLLDVTDNLVDGSVVHPDRVVVHDEDDPYLVVAADKGTASFSDTANGIASEYGFWLGDAFASGGSAGYDHKALGITARGAWESVKWHFHELGINPADQMIDVVGIGDMSGDVFGNGVLQSKQLKLVAAFDHRNIFIDPDPDPSVSWEERRRLYDSPDSSWASYDVNLISAGGGVYDRSAKRIDLPGEARAILGLEEAGEMTPAEVIRGILMAPVDLLWNGGIGTFVKASQQSHAQAGDRSNDGVRIDATDLRCRVVGEGGNLGLTQEARVEFARNGGRINTDFIDNSGGVNCSDREVNLKILLGMAEERGELDRAGRDALVKSVVDDVVERILLDNFLQAQILSQEAAASARELEIYEEVMAVLDSAGLLDRDLERLPSVDDMTERSRRGEGMTSPELSVLVAYSKRSVRDWILDSDLPDDPRFDADLARYFPVHDHRQRNRQLAGNHLRHKIDGRDRSLARQDRHRLSNRTYGDGRGGEVAGRRSSLRDDQLRPQPPAPRRRRRSR
jgi:glutamate dehydrogenase